jgi:hypothetical protein
MKNIIKIMTLALAVICANTGFSQDTLHLDFGNTQVVPDKAIEDKLVAWGKTLNGKKQDIMIVAYYHKGDFKKFAEQRVEEMFLSVNRKVRNLVNIKSQEAKKGEDYQRTRVDIIYYPEGQDAKSVAEKKKADEKAAKEAEKKKKEEEEKLAKEKKSGSSGSSTAKNDKKEPAKITPNNKPFVANDEFKSRKLLVVLLSENEKAKEKLAGKPDELEAYKANIKAHNENITMAFKKSWNDTPLEFITEAELGEQDMSEKSTGFTVLAPGNKEVEKITFMTYKTIMVYVKGKDLALSEKEFKISLNGPAPQPGDYYLLMSKMRVFYKMQPDINPETQLEEKLKSKTLYVNKDLLELSTEEFKEEYPYPFEIKSEEEITKLANEMDKNALYVKTDVAYNPNMINLMIVEAETGNILSRTSQSGLTKVSMVMPSGRFGSSSGFKLGGNQLNFFICTTCGVAGMELFRLYTAKPKLKRPMINILKDGKKQKKYYTPTTIY